MSTFSSDIGPEEEDGAGWGGLAPTKAERQEEARQAELERDAARGRALVAAVSKAMLEGLAGATEPLEGRAPGDRWDDGYINGFKACAAIVQAAMFRAA